MIRPLSGFSQRRPQRTNSPQENGARRPLKPDPTVPRKNPIFWGTKPATGISLIQRMRTMFWFYPDFLGIFLHRFRPFSFLLIYLFILFIGWNTITYAKENPQSVLNNPPSQEIREGVIGSVSTINPLYVTHNQIERDLQELVFNRLIRIGPDGNPVPEIASTWAISEDGREYTFFIRENIHWHDGEHLTADDVVFTFSTVQNLEGEDSYSNEFEDIEFEKINDLTVKLTLPETNPTLIDSLAFPIVPEHILGKYNKSDIRFSNFNKIPIGTGPFMIVSNTDEQIVLQKNADYFQSEPLLDKITYIFFDTEEDALDALKLFEIHTLTQATQDIMDEIEPYKAYTVHTFATPLRQKIIYFNLRNTGPLSSSAIRQALSTATDKDTLITSVPLGGTRSDGPIPSGSWAYNTEIDRYTLDTKRANELLDQSGWTYADEGDTYRTQNDETLSVTVSYLDTNINNIIIDVLKEQWKSVGVELIPDPQSYDRISSETVPRRNFDALLFEIECTSDPDKYNLWHSTKSDYPGLNLSGYSYERVDILLERARSETDKTLRKQDYDLFQKYILSDMPALYLYNPNYAFIAHDSIKGIELENAILPHHRYYNVEDWYIEK